MLNPYSLARNSHEFRYARLAGWRGILTNSATRRHGTGLPFTKMWPVVVPNGTKKGVSAPEMWLSLVPES